MDEDVGQIVYLSYEVIETSLKNQLPDIDCEERINFYEPIGIVGFMSIW
jgi:hypothetical protein